MANEYVLLADFKTRLGITGTGDDTELQVALSAASKSIEKHCHRKFWADTNATARVYRPSRSTVVWTHDFLPATVPVIATDDDGDGTYETTWLATDYQLEPLNPTTDIARPYEKIVALTRCFPCWGPRATVQVTAKWGWPAVPDEVVDACRILATDLFKSKDTAFGVAGTTDLGVLRIKQNDMVSNLLGGLISGAGFVG